MRLPPLSVLITWPIPNYVDPITRGNASLIVNGIFIALVLIVVTLRFYCRTSAGVLRLGWDDAMISLALLFTLGLAAVVILAEKLYGWDRHVWDIPPDRITNANIIALVAKVVFSLAATFTRLSLCCFYYRLVRDSGIVWFKNVVHLTNAFTIAVCIAFLFISIFQCTPVKYYWEYPPTTAGTCMDEGKATLAAGIINLFNDFLCAVIPIPLFMNLQMPLKQRVGVCILFGLGFIVIVAGSVRTYFIWKGLMQSYDETWYAYPLWICAAVEIDVGVICACAPALKSLLHFSRESSRSSHSATSGPRPSLLGSLKVPSTNSSLEKSSHFNVTAKIPWSWQSRSSPSRGTVRLHSHEGGAHELSSRHSLKLPMQSNAWPDYDHDVEEGDGEQQALHIMRRRSVELSSMRSGSDSIRRPSASLGRMTTSDGRPVETFER